jgi:hypothetical protein
MNGRNERTMIVARRITGGKSGGVVIHDPATPTLIGRKAAVYVELRGLGRRQVQTWIAGKDGVWMMKPHEVIPATPWQAHHFKLDIEGVPRGWYSVDVFDGEIHHRRELKLE